MVIVEEEARWVHQIFAWYVARVPLMEIRRRLIAAGAPQKGSSRPPKIQWSVTVIQAMLINAQSYASGVKIQRRIGEEFQIPIEPIIDLATLQRVLDRRAANKRHPANHQKADYLLGGLIKCACGRTWAANTRTLKTDRAGNTIRRKTPNGNICAASEHPEHVSPDCPRSIGSKKADDLAWSKVRTALDNPDLLIAGAQEYVDQLRSQAESILKDQAAIQARLDGFESERQNVIRLARKNLITDDELSLQLVELDLNDLNARKALAECQQIVDLAALGQWEEHARRFWLI